MIQFVLKKAHPNTFNNFLKNDVANTADARFWSTGFASYCPVPNNRGGGGGGGMGV